MRNSVNTEQKRDWSLYDDHRRDHSELVWQNPSDNLVIVMGSHGIYPIHYFPIFLHPNPECLVSHGIPACMGSQSYFSSQFRPIKINLFETNQNYVVQLWISPLVIQVSIG
jgi:hypothetical protein